MIQLSSILPFGPENSRNTAELSGTEGIFASLLAGDSGNGADDAGKILPESGKSLPQGLPVRLFALHAARKPVPGGGADAELPDLGDEAGGIVAIPVDDAAKGAEDAGDDAELQGAGVPVFANLTLPAPALLAIPVERHAAARGGQEPAQPHLEHGRKEISAKMQAAAQSLAENGDATVQPRNRIRTSAAALIQATANVRREGGEAPARESIEGGKPADAPQPARIAPSSRPQPFREIKLEFAREAGSPATPEKPFANAEADRFPTVAAVQTAGGALSMAQGDVPAGRDVNAPGFDSAVRHQAVRPQDFAMLVDRLVEARENSRPAEANLNVMHAEFGEVSLRFGHENGNLIVSLGNSDPGFARAVGAAVASDGASSGDAAFRGEGGNQGGRPDSAREAADRQGSGGERGQWPREARAERTSLSSNSTVLADRSIRRSMGGILA